MSELYPHPSQGPDPWLEGEDLEKFNEEVANHPLTEQAGHIEQENEKLAKEVEARRADEAVDPGVANVDDVTGVVQTTPDPRKEAALAKPSKSDAKSSAKKE